MFGVERKLVKPDWKTRLYRWLDMESLKPQFSIEVRDPDMNKWAHVYEEGDEFVKLFKDEAEANRYMEGLKHTA